MCKHTKLELSGRIENFNGHRYVNIYNCKIENLAHERKTQ